MRVGEIHARDAERRGMRGVWAEIKGIREGTKGGSGVKKRR